MPQLRRCNLKKMPRQESVCLQIDFWRFVNAIAASCDYPAKVGHSRPVHSQQSGTKQHQTGPSLLPALQTEDEHFARAIAASCDHAAKDGHSRPVHGQQSGTKQRQTGPSLLPALQTEDEHMARATAAAMGQAADGATPSGRFVGRGAPSNARQDHSACLPCRLRTSS